MRKIHIYLLALQLPFITNIHGSTKTYVKAGYEVFLENYFRDAGSGMYDIRYRTGDTGEYLNYTMGNPIVLLKSGKYKLSYYGSDYAGNWSKIYHLNKYVDGILPNSYILSQKEPQHKIYTSTTNYRIVARDDESGISEIRLRINDGKWVNYRANGNHYCPNVNPCNTSCFG